ncbi:MAG TPA: hypothetical protein V6C91_15460 [Coleofasciculaceae cyanobacterium]
MQITQKVCCPNCGSHAERLYFTKTYIMQTQCPVCDYLMINCSRTGKVVEAYAPGIHASSLRTSKFKRSKAKGSEQNVDWSMPAKVGIV